ncbi:MAG: tRNA1(Val) (adenine(37)-N6)-methyltransferase [Solirubrobacteraceae bacterium]
MFQFKQFNILQDRCAMKIGTDGVLLGAWCPIDNNPKIILDIGTGTGIIALMLAQRTDAIQIDAIEIEENAFEQATDNFENSIWADRITCYHAGLDELVDEPDDEYDLIVCNPPFYSEDFKTGDERRDAARFQDAMPFEELVDAAHLLLSENGIFAVIIPFKEEDKFIDLCANCELFPINVTRVKGNLTSEIKRSLLAFKRYELPILTTSQLVIEVNRNEFTVDYINLTKDFYLKM